MTPELEQQTMAFVTEVLRLFRCGYDTKAISLLMQKREYVVERALHVGLGLPR
jgi:hypothetical protein